MIIITVLLAGAATLTSIQLQSTHGATIARTNVTALHCAEAGLAAARSQVTANYPSWNAWLGQTAEPSWLSTVNHDLDGDGVADFTLRLRDNDDEPVTNNPYVDNDLAVFVVSTCVKFGDAPVAVTELVRLNGGGNCYQAQLGGCGGNANAN